MDPHLEITRAIRIGKPGEPAYAVAQSANGQYTAVTNETGLTLFDAGGTVRLRYPPQAWPIHLVTAPGDFSYLLVGTRRGGLTRLNLLREGETFQSREQVLYFADNDLNTLSLSSERELLGVGHYGPALAVLDIEGQTLWRRHPDSGNATNGQFWSVALDEVGHRLYIASAGPGTNQLAVLEADSGVWQNGRSLDGRITRMTTLPQNRGVVIVLNDGYSYWLQVYDSSLDDLLWENEYGDPVTAVASDRSQALLAIATGYQGNVTLMNAETGAALTEPLPTQSYVNDIAMSRGSSITAVTEDGSLYLIRYQSASMF
ncbi:MAG: hypothetical protein KC441_05670 [Anaerolineales bacterium]|nr:hypothetical protein [Anaerolineales bacterium]